LTSRKGCDIFDITTLAKLVIFSIYRYLGDIWPLVSVSLSNIDLEMKISQLF